MKVQYWIVKKGALYHARSMALGTSAWFWSRKQRDAYLFTSESAAKDAIKDIIRDAALEVSRKFCKTDFFKARGIASVDSVTFNEPVRVKRFKPKGPKKLLEILPGKYHGAVYAYSDAGSCYPSHDTPASQERLKDQLAIVVGSIPRP